MNSKLKTIVKYALTIAIIVISVNYAIKGVDYDKLWIDLANADYKWALIPIPIMLASHWLRALRWKTMLKPIMHTASMMNLFSAVMIGYAFNNITPRGGEFVRPWIFAKKEKVSFSSVFATIIVERIIDVVALGMLFAISFVLLREKIVVAMPRDIDPNKIIFLSGLIVTVLIFSFYPPFVEFFLKTFIKPFSEKYYEKIASLFVKFRRGFAIIKSPGDYFRLIVESMAIWLCYMLPMYFMFFCFDFKIEYHFGLTDALLLLIVTGVGVTIAPTPGAIGIYHGLIVATMTTLYGVSKETALAYATINHGVNFIVQVAVGGMFFFKERKYFAGGARKEEVAEELKKGAV